MVTKTTWIQSLIPLLFWKGLCDTAIFLSIPLIVMVGAGIEDLFSSNVSLISVVILCIILKVVVGIFILKYLFNTQNRIKFINHGAFSIDQKNIFIIVLGSISSFLFVWGVINY